MKRLLKGFFAMAVALSVLGGCAMDPTVKPWWTLREANFLALQPGKIGKPGVRAALGRPFGDTVFANLGEEVWDYRYPDGARIMLAWVYFDASGMYKYYTAQPDPAFYSGKD